VNVRYDVHLTDADLARQLRDDVRRCFEATMELPPRWFYDERGCELFDAITRLEAYYPTRREREILLHRAPEIAAITGAATLIELGSGSSEKTRLLLDALAAGATLRTYVPFDVSHASLRASAPILAAAYGIEVHAIVGDFEQHLADLPVEGRSIVAFLGSTIGNLDPAQRSAFCKELAACMSSGSWFLLGSDLVKDPRRLIAAYDDDTGITAAFNRNVLHVLNREVGTSLDADAFTHVARWNPSEERMEMSLRAERAQHVVVETLGIDARLPPGCEIRTEISCKFRPDGIRDELAAAGFDVVRWWTDAAGDFGLALARRI
jgi:L-histidine N-alpha-methyltransferase